MSSSNKDTELRFGFNTRVFVASILLFTIIKAARFLPWLLFSRKNSRPEIFLRYYSASLFDFEWTTWAIFKSEGLREFWYGQPTNAKHLSPIEPIIHWKKQTFIDLNVIFKNTISKSIESFCRKRDYTIREACFDDIVYLKARWVL